LRKAGRARPEGSAMPEGKGAFREVLPKQGTLSVEDTAGMVLCKPKVLPLKSVSLERLEQLHYFSSQSTIFQQQQRRGSQRLNLTLLESSV
uniref:BBSome interacting protein 1 n=1 Tax=Meleagris gallopavo TaxID=9103 RepID=A0A803YGM7_MELGA